MIISVISVRSPHQVGIHVVESNNSLFPIISIIGVESTCRNFRPPFIGTFGRHSTELSAAVHWNFWAPFIGTFGRHLLELSTAIHWNFQPPFIETFGCRSSELSTAIHLNFRPPFITTFGLQLTKLIYFRWPFIGTFERHS